MDYVELEFTVPQDKVDLVSTFLVAGGYDTFEVQDLADLVENAGAMFCDYIEDELLDHRDDTPKIRFYMEREEESRAREIRDYLLGVCTTLGYEDITAEIRLVEGSDWDTRWKKYFYPFPVGERLFIKPAWDEVPEEQTRGREIIEIDPAAAFGSGTHATTRLCLEAAETCLKPGDRVLDMGCGSGILGIGAAKLGASYLCAVDIDEAAVRTTAENLEKNGIDLAMTSLICGNVLAEEDKLSAMGGGYQVILANIVAQIIKDMAPLLYRALEPDGTLLASGILECREQEVRAALEEAGFIFKNVRRSEEWVLLEMTK
ncbi:MAG: 50S ribosomal protein L11 methyltransferase [Clostridia bacterium]|nr:50S ribosomal protein L11 methyltransferase [Clostridia bacterium]